MAQGDTHKNESVVTTSMVITDVAIVEAGPSKGSMVIAVQAKRGEKDYNLSFQVFEAKIPEMDLEALKVKVIERMNEIDNAEALRSKQINQFILQKGKEIKL